MEPELDDNSAEGLRLALGELLTEVATNTETTEAARLEAEMLRHEVRNQRRALIWVVGAVGVGLVLIVFLALAWGRLTRLAESNKALNQETRANSARLVECTEPSPGKGKGKGLTPAEARADDVHECYERGVASQATAVAAIVDTNGNGIPDSAEVLALLRSTTTTAPRRP